MNLKSKFILSVVGLVGAVVLGVGSMIFVTERRLLKSEMDQKHRHQVERLARVCEESLIQDELILFNYLKGLKNERGFYSAGFVDLNGKIHSHFNPSRIGSTFQSPHEKRSQQSNEVFVQEYSLEKGPTLLDYAAPVYLGESRAGTARLLINKEVLDAFVHESLKATLSRLLFISFGALLIGLFGAIWLSKTMVSPINIVVKGMQDVSHGKLEPLPELHRKDELGGMVKELNITIKKLKELETMKSEFVASVTHELRSPLTAIDRLVSLGLKGAYGPISSKWRESVLIVKNNTTRLAGFVDQILMSSKLEAHRVNLFCESFGLKAILKDIHSLYAPLAKEKRIEFTLNLPKESLTVWADRDKVTQVLSNLLSNAFKFTKEGNVTLRAEKKKDRVEVSVHDTGKGIPEGDLDKVFDKFYQVPETARTAKGTGLGLSIVKGLLEIQKGGISAKNNPKKGACFTFFLPIKAH